MHDLGCNMSERTIGRMLKKLGLRSRIARKYKHRTDSNHRLPTAPNLLDRQFTVTQPNKVWTTDITYICTKESWLCQRHSKIAPPFYLTNGKVKLTR